MTRIDHQDALDLARAISRLYRVDPCSQSPCAAQAEQALARTGWRMDWHEFKPPGSTPVDCRDHHAGRYLTETQPPTTNEEP